MVSCAHTGTPWDLYPDGMSYSMGWLAWCNVQVDLARQGQPVSDMVECFV